MKRYLLILLVVFILVTTSGRGEGFDQRNIELRTGVSYNNFLYRKYEAGEVDKDYFVREDLHQGTGYYTELVYWVTENIGLGVGCQYNKMKAEWESSKSAEQKVTNCSYICSLDNYYTKLIYFFKSNLSPYLNIGYNIYSEEYQKGEFSTPIKRGTGLGLTLGVESNLLIKEKIGISFDVGYNLNKIQIGEEYSSYHGRIRKVEEEALQITGLQIRGRIDYSF